MYSLQVSVWTRLRDRDLVIQMKYIKKNSTWGEYMVREWCKYTVWQISIMKGLLEKENQHRIKNISYYIDTIGSFQK